MKPGFFELARRPDVVRRALRIAAIVGTLLIAINYGDRILAGRIETADVLKMLLTIFVPYGVSTVSSVAALRDAGAKSREG